MKLTAKAVSATATAVLALSALAPAHAMLVLQGPEDFQGTGLGAVNTILTLESPANSTVETGSVERMVGSTSDIISGDAKTGASQTQTLSFAEVGVSSAADIRVVFNALEPGNPANGISLDDLVLTIYNSTGTELFNSGAFTPISFADTLTGAGNSGFVFALDAVQAAAAQAAAFTGDFGSNLFGLSASLSNATGGFETFFVASADGTVTPPIPEPQTYALMLAGLGAVGFMAMRRRRQNI
jgi:PEP-CTERM motif